MSVQFGRWNFDGAPTDPEYVEEVRRLLSPYAPDGLTIEAASPLTLLFGAFHTTCESRREHQPYLSPSGDRIMWDGRLDNRADCVSRLCIGTKEATDLEIVAAAYERWSSGAFGLLIGDWALSAWRPSARSLVLARDFLGTRQLYYSFEGMNVTWSTILDPLVLLRNRPLTVCEQYVAGWLSAFPSPSLTPYEGIFAVPPASCATIRHGEVVVREYWKFDPGKRVQYRTDHEYEEHFLAEFRESVRRRMRSDRPVLAELSGGMDSSSIVCVADRLISEGGLNSPRLDTVSYYDDTEPNWNERPYFTRVETQRGRAGFHIDVSASESLTVTPHTNRFLATPSSSDSDSESGFAKRFSECIASGPYQILLSGVGGDEVTGGIPTPLPELADLLAGMKFKQLGRQLVRWSLAKRKPALHLLLHTIGSFLPSGGGYSPHPTWLRAEFVRRNREAISSYRGRLKLLGSPPSFQANMIALDGLRRQLSCTPLPFAPTYEKRYPYLDRDLLAFCYSVPREQLVRPGQRRSLLRRAMAGIVPDEILLRRRKAFGLRRLIATLSQAYDNLVANRHDLLCASFGIVEPDELLRTLDEGRKCGGTPLIPIIRAIALEQWLRTLPERSVIVRSSPALSGRARGNGQILLSTNSRPRKFQRERG